jgi:hypothetical protein
MLSEFESEVRQTNKFARQVLKVFTVYEDYESGRRAKKVFEILDRGSVVFSFMLNLWKSDILKLPNIRSQVAEETAAADIVIIAAQNSSALTPELSRWLTEWLAIIPRQPRVLLAFSGDGTPSPFNTSETNATKELGRMAEQAGIKFHALNASFTEVDHYSWTDQEKDLEEMAKIISSSFVSI